MKRNDIDQILLLKSHIIRLLAINKLIIWSERSNTSEQVWAQNKTYCRPKWLAWHQSRTECTKQKLNFRLRDLLHTISYCGSYHQFFPGCIFLLILLKRHSNNVRGLTIYLSPYMTSRLWHCHKLRTFFIARKIWWCDRASKPCFFLLKIVLILIKI